MISSRCPEPRARRLATAATLCSLLAVAASGCVADPAAESGFGGVSTQRIRMGHWNIKELGTAKILDPDSTQLPAMAEILARFHPDILSVNELQFDIENVPEEGLPGAPAGTQPGNACEGRNARRLADRLHELQPDLLEYDYSLVAMGNSGVPFETTEDVADNFKVRPDEFLGRYSIGLLSRYPILHDQVRVLHDLAWSDLPGNRIQRIHDELGIDVPVGYPLFEKAIVVVPVDVEGMVFHVILLHPMTSGFSPMNPHRNHDELRALTLWLDGELSAPGWEPLPADARFVIVGDLNVDPEDGEGDRDSIAQVLADPRVVAHFPEGEGSTRGTNPRRNSFLSGCGREDGQMPWNPTSKMQMQLDYMLPSTTVGAPAASGINWPTYPSEDWNLACRASDHRFVWEDLDLHAE